ncbi:alpha/beta hydrolase [Nocardia bhagyanarayanae]|uniref:alpha/beta hydrolase n=1 Tax=Nocardia bhagyanarayanae TaxID=1215925 RepID=UPI002482D755|nr:alpha/beta fold hydrolase [Nocardia bhagyanarayanae]
MNRCACTPSWPGQPGPPRRPSATCYAAWPSLGSPGPGPPHGNSFPERGPSAFSDSRSDIAAAVAFAREHERIDPGRVLLWGNSLGGAHVITVAASDPRIAAVVAQIPFNGFPKKVEGRSTGDTLKLLGAILWDALRGRLGVRPYYIPMVGHPGELAVTASPEAEQHIQALTGGQNTLWRKTVAPRGLLRMMRYHPAESAARLSCPLLVCVAAEDRETPLENSRELADRAPHGELVVHPGTHFTFYTNPEFRDRVVADQIDFYRRTSASV